MIFKVNFRNWNGGVAFSITQQTIRCKTIESSKWTNLSMKRIYSDPKKENYL